MKLVLYSTLSNEFEMNLSLDRVQVKLASTRHNLFVEIELFNRNIENLFNRNDNNFLVQLSK